MIIDHGHDVDLVRGARNLTRSIGRHRTAARNLLRRFARRIRGEADVRALQRSGLRLGDEVYIGIGAHLDPDFCFLVSIGDRSVLSINVTVLAHDASTRHSVGWTRIAPVTIEADVFVGAGAIILPGVTVGRRSVIAAGSVVRHDVPEGTIVAGNPARPIGLVDAYIATHATRLETTPAWPRRGWTATTGITPERVAAMRAKLAEHGEAYIK